MIGLYLIGGLLGILGGCAAVLLAEDRWRQLFPLKELFSANDREKKQRILLLAAGLLLGLYDVWLYGSIDLNYVGHFLLCIGLLGATPSDIRRHEISTTLLIVFFVAGVLYNVCWLDIGILLNGFVGALIGFAVLGIPYLLRKGSVGLGDLFLMAICGIYTGSPEVIYFLIRALVFMAVWGIIKLVRRKADAASEVPFTPFLLLAAVI